MDELPDQLAEALRDASPVLASARDYVGDHFGLDDPLFDELAEAYEVVERAASRIEGRR